MAKDFIKLSQLDLNGHYSYADYLGWRFEQSVELIKGKIFPMSPSPNLKHQRISSRLHGLMFVALRGGTCELFAAPFDVRLLDGNKNGQANETIYTVVQPDLCLICDANKLDEQGCLGAPELIVEILSPGNSKREIKTKYALYEENGVLEYWVVYPSEQVLQQFVLDEAGRYQLKAIFAEDEQVVAHILPDLSLNLAEVFR